MSHPLPTRLTFLSLLHTFSPGEKVRFLGCITTTTPTATLILQHPYYHNPHPTSSPSAPFTKKAMIDISLLTSTLAATDTQIGEWIYVIGYVVSSGKSGAEPASEGGDERDFGGGLDAGIQALVVWSAGGIKLDEYERVVRERLRMEETMGE